MRTEPCTCLHMRDQRLESSIQAAYLAQHGPALTYSMESYMGLMRKIMSLLLLLLSRRFPWESGLMHKQ
jgi:hypothetical protein